jgi:hypothetical protein
VGSGFASAFPYLRESTQVGYHRNACHRLIEKPAMTTPEQKKSNLRMGLILASVAAVFFIGFLAKMILLSR